MTASLVRVDEHPDKPLVSGSQGNTQALADGNWLIGWGEEPYVSEFSPTGQLLFDAHLPAAYESYRAYRLPWTGQPTGPPALAYVRSSARPRRRDRLRQLERRDRCGRLARALGPLAGEPCARRLRFEDRL